MDRQWGVGSFEWICIARNSWTVMKGWGNHAQDHKKLKDHSCCRSDCCTPPPCVVNPIRKKCLELWGELTLRTAQRSAARSCYVTVFIKSKKTCGFPCPLRIIWLLSHKGCRYSEHWREGLNSTLFKDKRQEYHRDKKDSLEERLDSLCSVRSLTKSSFSIVRPPNHTCISFYYF